MARGDEGRREALTETAPKALPANPFYAGWSVAAANGRLVPKGSVRWAAGAGARLPVRKARRLGRLPLLHVAALAHDHCFSGEPDLGPDPQAGLGALARASDGSLLALVRVPEDAPAHAALAAREGAVILQTRHRAMLRSEAGYEPYVQGTLRAKKRKELRRLRARLAEVGEVGEATFSPGDDLAAWTEDFLALEAAGWKGEAGTAMGAREAERAYLGLLLEGARDAGALRLFRLTLGGRPAAMVIGLLGGAGGGRGGGLYTYKIAHDPSLARYSPGVMVMLSVTRHVLGSEEIAYADSCAKEGHRMIEQLWAERRTLHDWLVPTNAAGRAACAGLVALGKARRP